MDMRKLNGILLSTAIIGFTLFIIIGSSFFITDFSNENAPPDFKKCTGGESGYGTPVHRYNSSTVSGVIHYEGNRTFTMILENPQRKTVYIKNIHSVFLTDEENMTFSEDRLVSNSTKFSVTYRVSDESHQFSQKVFEKFDEDGYFPILPTSPRVKFDIKEGSQISSKVGYFSEDDSVRVRKIKAGCHHVMFVSPQSHMSEIGFNEVKESMRHLPYEKPYRNTYILSVDSQLRTGMRENAGQSWDNLALVKRGHEIGPAGSNVINHEYIHTRTESNDINYKDMWVLEGMTVYRDFTSRVDSGEITYETYKYLAYKSDSFSEDGRVTGEWEYAYTSGYVIFSQLESKYGVNLSTVEQNCPNYSSSCFYKEIKKQDTGGARFFKNMKNGHVRQFNTGMFPIIGSIQHIMYLMRIHEFAAYIFVLLVDLYLVVRQVQFLKK